MNGSWKHGTYAQWSSYKAVKKTGILKCAGKRGGVESITLNDVTRPRKTNAASLTPSARS